MKDDTLPWYERHCYGFDKAMAAGEVRPCPACGSDDLYDYDCCDCMLFGVGCNKCGCIMRSEDWENEQT